MRQTGVLLLASDDRISTMHCAVGCSGATGNFLLLSSDFFDKVFLLYHLLQLLASCYIRYRVNVLNVTWLVEVGGQLPSDGPGDVRVLAGGEGCLVR